MIGKALVKVTLNEATDPELFAYITRLDNERMRAGALRALARAALSGDGTGRVEFAAQLDAPLIPTTDAPARRRPTEVIEVVGSDSQRTVSTDPIAFAQVEPIEPRVSDATTASSLRFDTDAIAAQFADF